MVKVSIIVPIYNVEKYLRRSIDSIQNQTLKDIEIILVNDGSPDNSLSICREYAKKDKRIKIIDKPNGGVSSARNEGMKIATAEYIGFVDPDDWIEPEMYENMYKNINDTDSDICMSDYVIDDGRKIKPMILNIDKDNLNRDEIIDMIIPDMISAQDLNSGAQTIMGNVWRLLINRKLIDDYDFIFPESIHLMEDLIFCIGIFLKADGVSIDKGQYYHYMTNYDSAVRSYRKDSFKTQKVILNKIKDILIEEKTCEGLKERLEIRYVSMCIGSISNEVHRDNNKIIVERIKTIKGICKDSELNQILETIDIKDYTLRKKMTLYAMRKEMSLYLYLYYTILTRIII